MSLMSVTSRFGSFLLRRQRLGTTCSCSRLELLFSSSSIRVVHSHSNSTNPNYIPQSTRIPYSYLKLQQLLNENKSGFDNLDNALGLFRKMLKMRPLPCDFHFNQLLTILVKMKHYPVAVSLFRDMCTLSIPVDIYTFNIAINCYCHCNGLDYSFSLLASIFKRGFVPDVVTYTTLIRGLLSQQKSAEARLFFTNLIKFREFQPSVITYNTMINGLCKTGHTDMALWLFNYMEKSDCKPVIVTYNTVIDSLCKQGHVDDALNLQSEMTEKGILPDVWTYNPIIQVLCSLNRWEEVTMLLKQMIDDMKIYPDVHTFNILVDAHSKSGKLDDAKQIIVMMNERGKYPNIVTYNALMQAYFAKGQIGEALAVLNTIISKGMWPTVETHSILLHGLCQLGKPIEALTLFYKIQDQGYMLNIVMYHTILTGLCKNQYVDKALCLFQLMSCYGLIPDRDTYNIIIRGCLCNKKYNEACKLVDEMVDCGFLADAITSSLLRHLLSSEVQDPTLLAMYQKCLHSGIQEEFHGVHISRPIHIGCPAEKSIQCESVDALCKF